MTDFLCKLLKAGEPVLDTRADTLGTTKTCSQLHEHRRLIGLERDSLCFEDAVQLMVELYAK